MRFCVSGCTRGKEPVEATNGFICEQCYENLRNALQAAPEALQHLREVYVLKAPLDLEGAKPQKKDPPAPFNLDAWQLAEDMWQSMTGNYMPADWDHKTLYAKAQDKCQEIYKSLNTVVNTKEVIYLLPLIKTLRTALYRYPLEEKTRSTLLRCPECQQRTIYQPPKEFGDELEVKCLNCGFAIPPEKMEFYANLAERERDANL